MSARRPTVALKPGARRDVRAILLDTGEHWGPAQREAYQEAIDQAFQTLSANPRIGRSRDEISPGLHSYQVRQHVIFYRVTAGTVTVVRVLHGRVDAIRHLEE